MNAEAAASPQVAAVDITTGVLLEAVGRLGLVMSADRRVSEESAAKLLGISHAHLKESRQQGNAPMHFVLGVGGSRLSYRVSDLASWIEAGREDPLRQRRRRQRS